MLLPAAAADLLGDQRVGGVLVGDAQQRLGEAHQDDAFLGGEAVLVHEGIDAAVLVAVGARGAHQPARQLGDAPALVGRGRWRARRGPPTSRASSRQDGRRRSRRAAAGLLRGRRRRCASVGLPGRVASRASSVPAIEPISTPHMLAAMDPMRPPSPRDRYRDAHLQVAAAPDLSGALCTDLHDGQTESMSAAVPVMRTLEALRAQVGAWRRAGETVALVPTMGALHEGHLDAGAAGQGAMPPRGRVDLRQPGAVRPARGLRPLSARRGRRPRQARERRLRRSCGRRTARVMYPDGLCHPHRARPAPPRAWRATSRPHFFGGVATVCCKLFTQVGARRRRVRREGLPAALRRQADGARPRPAARDRRRADRARGRRPRPVLAQRLPDARAAPHRARCSIKRITRVAAAVSDGGDAGAGRGGRAVGAAAGRASSPSTTSRCAMPRRSRPPTPARSRPLRVLAAAWLGKTRLIDNVAVERVA